MGSASRSPRKLSFNPEKQWRPMMAEHLDLVLERTLDAPRDLVWQAQTRPEHLKHWFAPKPYEISEAEIDLRAGGIFRIRMIGPHGFHTVHGDAGPRLSVL